MAPDEVLALLLLALNLTEIQLADADAGEWTAAAPSALLLTIPLARRRQAPLVVLTLVVSGYAGQVAALGYFPSLALLVTWMLAIYSVAAHAPRSHVAVAVPLALVPVWAFLSANGRALSDVAPAELILAVVPAAAGWAVREMRQRADTAERRAAERDRAARTAAELAAAQERAHITRELHDVVAHSVSVIVVQAEAAEALLDCDLERGRVSLQAIQVTGRQALAELRQMLGVLRTDEASRDLAPKPTLARLPALIEQVRAAGLHVELSVTGSPQPLSSGAELCAYRVVQEGLTNALKHADVDAARVTLRYLGQSLEIEVTDTGSRGARGAPGFGLVGMRERVAVHGGELVAGPCPDGGFSLRVRLPQPART